MRTIWGVAVGIFLLVLVGPVRAEAAETLRSKQDIFRTSSAALGDRWTALSTAEMVAAYVERAIPFRSWIHICHAIRSDRQFGFLMGSCLERQRVFLQQIPVVAFEEAYRTALDRLWDSNPLDAIKFAHDMQWQRHDDVVRDDAISIAQIGLAVIVVIGFIVAAIYFSLRVRRRQRRHAALLGG